ncbi:hypothetical protein PO909_016929 [Leuciscus waleckii]
MKTLNQLMVLVVKSVCLFSRMTTADDVGDAEAPTSPKKPKTSVLMDLLGPVYKAAAPASKKTVTEMVKEEVARVSEEMIFALEGA